MEAAICTARKEQREPDKVDSTVSQKGVVLDIVATIDPKLWKFCSRYVNAASVFYRVKAKAKSWVEDRKWLERNWIKVDSDVDLFAKETKTWGVTREAVRNRHQVLANEVISKFSDRRLRSEYATKCGKVTICFEDVVGRVCRGWLSDSSIDFCLSEIAASTEGCRVLSSLLWQIGWPATPRVQLRDIKFVVHPVNLSASHWGTIIVNLGVSDGQIHARPHIISPISSSLRFVSVSSSRRARIKLVEDALIKNHLGKLYEQLLESNLIKIIQPFSCVDIAHVAKLIKLPLPQIELKLSQMILDHKFHGILDQGKGQLIVYDSPVEDKTYTSGLGVIENVGNIVDNLFRRADKLQV
ncbi:26S proteasome non-ATPase regulatory subunit 11, putative [Phytophthora infestans T30-4]|uniref:26S proteasome non-ATPase regulatory subunit 11, putative n=1 Tax=Phytophthora infestans (strain T30-4) TaxID=403677 RepID=D0MSF9_PHYIT|nr:26S proteasome non-ATPase regulatory subunit 11, putative [Phytophthora infestans T30-4]EEY58428.1 26S proteasome non-ATPase regulatory subunit 11, putative [Phytophthora infestans T30-4]|eukprot:XP_002909614.1 26S proteasome non-ATPase regulatory subunit 11, putative [Phytophthora infestans T30-4]